MQIKPGTLLSGSAADRETAAEGSVVTSKLAGGTQSLSSQRQRLPIYKQRSRLLNLVERYGVLVVVGQTVRCDDPPS